MPLGRKTSIIWVGLLALAFLCAVPQVARAQSDDPPQTESQPEPETAPATNADGTDTQSSDGDVIDLDAAKPVDAVTTEPEEPAEAAPSDALNAAEEAAKAAQDAARDAAEQAAKAAQEAERERAAAAARQAQAQRRAVRRVRAQVPPTITVRDIVFTPSGYLSPEELAAVEAQFVGSAIRADATAPILEAVNALYAEKDVVLAQAVLSSVDVATGTIHIELFEARIGEITYQSRILSKRYLAMRTGIRSGDLADVARIQRRLDRLALTDGIRVIANFAPGAERGLTNLELVVAEPRRISGSAGVDTYGSPGTGEIRGTIAARWYGITGWNDAIDISGNKSRGAYTISASYGVTVSPSGLRLGVFGTYEESETWRFPEVEARTKTIGLTASQPLIVRENLQLSLDARAFAFDDRSWIIGQPLLDQRGIGGYGGLSGAFTRGGFTLRGSGGVQVINWEDRIFGSGHETSTSITGTLAALQTLPLSLAATLSAGGQFAFEDPVPSDYRTTVASYAAVRGYPESLSAGDTGFYVRAQIEKAEPFSVPLDPAGTGESTRALEVRPFVFHDIGRAYDVFNGNQFPQDLLQSAGAGLSLNIGNVVVGDLYAAMPLRDANGFNADNHWDFRFSLSMVLQ